MIVVFRLTLRCILYSGQPFCLLGNESWSSMLGIDVK